MDPVPDPIDDLEESGEEDAFNEFKEKFAYVASKQPHGSPNVGKSAKNVAKLSNTCRINAASPYPLRQGSPYPLHPLLWEFSFFYRIY